jgi:hypothetical protein
MSETQSPATRRGYRLGPQARVVVLRRPEGYAVAVVHSEGPFSREDAEAMAAALRRTASGQLTKAEAASILGITPKGVDYLRRIGHIKTIATPGKKSRVLIDADSVRKYQEIRDGG